MAKTHSILISTKQKHKSLKSRNEALDLKIRDNELEVVQKTKYLGVQIDCCLDWKEQIKAVSTKVSRAIGFLRHAKSFLPQASLETLYTGIVEPHFRYCCSVWGCAGSTDINQLQKLQNRAARIITNSSFDTPSIPLIAELGWQAIEELIDNEAKIVCWGDKIRLTEETKMFPRAVGQSACACQSFNPKPLLRMSYNLLHGGTHKFPRAKHTWSPQQNGLQVAQRFGSTIPV